MTLHKRNKKHLKEHKGRNTKLLYIQETKYTKNNGGQYIEK